MDLHRKSLIVQSRPKCLTHPGISQIEMGQWLELRHGSVSCSLNTQLTWRAKRFSKPTWLRFIQLTLHTAVSTKDDVVKSEWMQQEDGFTFRTLMGIKSLECHCCGDRAEATPPREPITSKWKTEWYGVRRGDTGWRNAVRICPSLTLTWRQFNLGPICLKYFMSLFLCLFIPFPQLKETEVSSWQSSEGNPREFLESKRENFPVMTICKSHRYNEKLSRFYQVFKKHAFLTDCDLLKGIKTPGFLEMASKNPKKCSCFNVNNLSYLKGEIFWF